MSNYMTNISAQALLEALSNAGYCGENEIKTLEGEIVAQRQETELPLYLRALVGVGSFISSLCLIGFLSVAHLIEFGSEASFIFWGIVFICAALMLARAPHDKVRPVKHSFLMQSSFCAMGVGKLLFVMGFADLFGRHEQIGMSIALTFITLLTYPVYRMSVDRFLSSLAVLISLLANIIDSSTGASLMVNLYVAGLLCLAGKLFMDPRMNRSLVPLGYAAACALCVTVTILAADLYGPTFQYAEPLVAIILSFTLVALMGWAARDYQKLTSLPLFPAAIGAMAMGMFSAPGIILSIILLVLGYARHERLLIALGGMLMPVVLCLYYYNMELSLMVKSGVLIASGMLLLGGYVYLISWMKKQGGAYEK